MPDSRRRRSARIIPRVHDLQLRGIYGWVRIKEPAIDVDL
jgi:hypothetical protein